ncbi:phage portal protein [Achromobacter sp. UMC71]|uniref:phage portal protein n=1 Tax=Achromobacter sp. UMC71 TaxID=1862320 RepID=UPI0015FF9F30|nr:phage portal protein [Achromobacter sp. UMC71]MBB1625168.1 phage portal protein [Achromobacter sp. UMC71]
MTSLVDTSGKPLEYGTAARGEAAGVEAFTFGDPTPVLDRRDILDYIECLDNGRWYEPPVSFQGLAKSFRASTHHSSAIFFKANVLASTLVPNPLVSAQLVKELAINYQTFGNCYVEARRSRTGRTVGLRHSPAKYTRCGKEPDQFFFVPGLNDEHEFARGSIFHLKSPDINQEVYGLPEYLSTLQSAWLNESATLFRRRYYNNGSHAGFVMYLSDAGMNDEDVGKLRQALHSAKGPGNFRNLFLHSPQGKKDGIQIIPISEVAARDDFFNIKNVTRDDILAAHRVPPQLMGIVPGATGGFGAVLPAAQVFARNEIEPLQKLFSEINNWLGTNAVRFEPYRVNLGEKTAA